MDCTFGVIIIDDEPRVGMLIKSLVEWEEMGLSCIAVISNAEDALDLIEKHRPPIVITDIRMPKVSGLDLISRVRDMGIETKFVVISGYKDFEYARKALQFGIENYLLKPINKNELNRNLREIVASLKVETMKHAAKEQRERIFDASKKLINRNIFEYIVKSGNGISLKTVTKLYGVEFPESKFNVIDIKLDHRNLEDINHDHDRLTIKRVLALVESEFAEVIAENIVSEVNSMHIVCLFNYSRERADVVQKAMNYLLVSIDLLLVRFERYDITIGVGREKNDFAAVGMCIDEARTAVDFRIKLGTGRIIRSEFDKIDNCVDIDEILVRYNGLLTNSLSSFSDKLMGEWIDAVFDDIQGRADFNYFEYYSLALVMVDEFSNESQHHDFHIASLVNEVRDLIRHCNSVKQLQDFLFGSLADVLEKLEDIVTNRINQPIRLAIEYINGHYNEEVQLKSMAELAGLNSTYFSVLFKKEIGKNFSSYLADLRIEGAKTKLINTNDTMAKIAGEVGYRDVRYFSRLFTKIVGIRPGLFRKLHS